MPEVYANEPFTTLSAGITNVQTTLVVASSAGFPPTGNFRIRIDNEFMIVTGVSGTTWTVTRGVESSSAVAHASAAEIRHILTAGGLVQGIADAAGVPTFLVASSTASVAVKSMADYVCDGVADQVEINAALAALPAAGGTVVLSEGAYSTDNQIVTSKVGSRLVGQGMGATSIVAASTFPNGNVVALAHASCELADLTIDGNKAQNGVTPGPAKTGIRCWGVLANYCTVRNVVAQNSPGNGVTMNVVSGTQFVNCQVNTADYVGFVTDGSAVVPTQVIGCKAINNVGGNFYIAGTGTQVIGCEAYGGTYGFQSVAGSVDVVFESCISRATTTGFILSAAGTLVTGCTTHGCTYGYAIGATGVDSVVQASEARGGNQGFVTDATGRAYFLGCSASGCVTYGFSTGSSNPTSAQVAIVGCRVYGVASSSYGIYMNAGSQHLIQGNRISNNGGYGILIANASNGTAIIGNYVSDSGLVGPDGSGFPHILISATNDCYVAGNSCKMSATANRASFGLQLSAASNTYVGHNDFYSAGAGTNGGQFQDSNPAVTRRVPRKIADFTVGTDAHGGTAMTAGTPIDIIANQNFTVSSSMSLIEVIVRGAVYIGGSVINIEGACHLIVDSSGSPQAAQTTKLGAGITQAAGATTSIMAGSAPVRFENLIPGVHTFKLIAQSNNTATLYLRGLTAAYAPYEFLNVQVWEVFR